MFFNSKGPILRNYVSALDRFLTDFDKKPEASSASRRAEEAKYARIFRLRDNIEAEARNPIWEKF